MSFLKKLPASYNGSDMLTVIGPEAVFHGSMTARGSLRVEGQMEGNISEAQEVVVGQGGRVRGNISAENVVVGGEVTGDVVCSVRLELKSGARVNGDIRSPKLLIEEGAVFDGACAMSDASQAHKGAEAKEGASRKS